MAMHADMEAQRFCEQLYQAIILIFSVAGFIVGYFMESFRITVYAVFGGVCIASAICVPDWGIFAGKDPPVWLPEGITKRPPNSGIKAAEEKKET
eukprot:CAMPEP_0196738254 /NCGR_PEP_ID=MMETSP1091-20130531/15715_1 /TAXON_ID=302021 /ORGANISM="Rhodomonas sp., Strain CCMP768" /LENGTH=94 /DNA_ID=CAMNT_0042082215 /DNA_START=9 /DNA_END=293 /DNA_ORIENTATION=-